MTRVIEAFEREWRDMAIVELDDEIARQAVTIVRDHRLRSSDAIHLASALVAAPPAGDVTFACYDRRLWGAAEALGFEMLPPLPP